MKDGSLYNLGGRCAVLLGATIILVDVIHWFLLDRAQAEGLDAMFPNAASFFASVAADPWPLRLQSGLLALIGLLGLAVVSAGSEAMRAKSPAWIGWTSALAYLGFAVGAINGLRALVLHPAMAAAYVDPGSSEAMQATLVANHALIGLDPTGFLSEGAVGLWIFAISLLALRGRVWPKGLVYVGVAAGVFLWLFVAGKLLGTGLLLAIGAGIGLGVLGPIWYIWVGLLLLRAAQSASHGVPMPA
jgi:hypothetical protein